MKTSSEIQDYIRCQGATLGAFRTGSKITSMLIKGQLHPTPLPWGQAMGRVAGSSLCLLNVAPLFSVQKCACFHSDSKIACGSKAECGFLGTEGYNIKNKEKNQSDIRVFKFGIKSYSNQQCLLTQRLFWPQGYFTWKTPENQIEPTVFWLRSGLPISSKCSRIWINQQVCSVFLS